MHRSAHPEVAKAVALFKRDRKVLEEKVGRQFADDMTPAKAARIRAAGVASDIIGQALERTEAGERAEAEVG